MKLNLLLKLSNLNSNSAQTLGHLNPQSQTKVVGKELQLNSSPF